MLECARYEINVPISANDFDTDPLLLNCKNGTLNLRTGELSAHSRRDLITKMCAVLYNDTAKCPVFLRFLDTIFNQSGDLIAYVQRILGYALTGDVGEKALFCFHGDGNNGKTTLLEVVRYLLADYAGQIMIESLLTDNAFHRATALADLADLRGARFVTTSEADQGKHLAEAQIKQLTGMGQVKSCRKYENPVEFPPTFKIFLDTNHKPMVRGQDAAVWSRLKLIPFTVTIPKDEIDKNLLEKLKREAPGILRWAVEGCLEWQRDGLNEPSEVSESVQEWQAESDPFGGFFENKCVLEPTATCTSTLLWSAFRFHCDAEGLVVTDREFTQKLKRSGCEPYRTRMERRWRGIQLKRDTGDA